MLATPAAVLALATLAATSLAVGGCRCSAEPAPLTLPPAGAAPGPPAQAAKAPGAAPAPTAGAATPATPAVAPAAAPTAAPTAVPAAAAAGEPRAPGAQEEELAPPETVEVPPTPEFPEPGAPGERAAAARRLFAALSTGDREAADRVLAEEAEWMPHGLTSRILRGRDAVWEHFAALRKAFPDLAVRPLRLVEGAREVIAQVTLSGTHSGALMGVAATDEPFRIAGVLVIEFQFGRARRVQSYPDTASLWIQLGAAEGKAQPAAPAPAEPEVILAGAAGGPGLEGLANLYVALSSADDAKALAAWGGDAVKVVDTTTGETVTGARAGTRAVRRWASGLADARLEFRGFRAIGSWAVVELGITGTHRGPLEGVRPTGKAVSVPAADLVHGTEEALETIWTYRNRALLLEQLGAQPARRLDGAAAP